MASTPCEATADDFPGYVALFQANECMRMLGKEHGNKEWEDIGDAYVNNALKTELSSWDACSARFQASVSRLWVMRDQGQIVGCVGVLQGGGEPDDDSSLELVRMYVDASCRRRGYGRTLVRTVLDHAATISASRVELTTPAVNKDAISFYEKMGFRVDKTFLVEDYGGSLEIAHLVQQVA